MKNWQSPNVKMNQWYGIMSIIYSKKTDPVSLVCPNCSKHTVHYFYTRNGLENKGGSWIWCSFCLTYLHATSLIPSWWKEVENVPLDTLKPKPEWLNDNLSKWEPILFH